MRTSIIVNDLDHNKKKSKPLVNLIHIKNHDKLERYGHSLTCIHNKNTNQKLFVIYGGSLEGRTNLMTYDPRKFHYIS